MRWDDKSADGVVTKPADGVVTKSADGVVTKPADGVGGSQAMIADCIRTVAGGAAGFWSESLRSEGSSRSVSVPTAGHEPAGSGYHPPTEAEWCFDCTMRPRISCDPGRRATRS
jgi:hypothetical protein